MTRRYIHQGQVQITQRGQKYDCLVVTSAPGLCDAISFIIFGDEDGTAMVLPHTDSVCWYDININAQIIAVNGCAILEA